MGYQTTKYYMIFRGMYLKYLQKMCLNFRALSKKATGFSEEINVWIFALSLKGNKTLDLKVDFRIFVLKMEFRNQKCFIQVRGFSIGLLFPKSEHARGMTMGFGHIGRTESKQGRRKRRLLWVRALIPKPWWYFLEALVRGPTEYWANYESIFIKSMFYR